jgi:hypothetical protein
MILLAVGLLLIGLMIGAAGMRRFGQLARRIVGPWRPGVGVGALIALFGAAALATRGAVLEGLALGVIGLGLAVGARRRPPRAEDPKSSPEPALGMGDFEARQVLGVGPAAGAAEIEAAYRRLMRRAHPDHGGSSGLASQLNAARAALIR